MQKNNVVSHVLSLLPEARIMDINSLMDRFMKANFQTGKRDLVVLSRDGFDEELHYIHIDTSIYKIKSIECGKLRLEEKNLADMEKEYQFYVDFVLGDGGVLGSCFDMNVEESVMALLSTGFRFGYYIGNSNKLYLNFIPQYDLKMTVVNKVGIEELDDRFEELLLHFVMYNLYLRREFSNIDLHMHHKQEYNQLKYLLVSRDKRNNRFGFMGGRR